MKRREFSSGMAGGILFAGINPAPAWSRLELEPRAVAMDFEGFRRRLNHCFSARPLSGVLGCRLRLETVEMSRGPSQFFARFRVERARRRLREDIYRLDAGDGEELLLHLQPVAGTADALVAVVNLERPA